MGFMDNISAFTKGVGAKAKGNYDVVAMNSQIGSLKKEINDVYLKIGVAYYEKFVDAPGEGFEEFVGTINQKRAEIEELTRQIELTKEATAAVSLTATASTVAEDSISQSGTEANSSGRFCVECGAPLDVDDLFCHQCGTRNEIIVSVEEATESSVAENERDEDSQVQVRYCKECGSVLNDGDMFCVECGTKQD